MKIFVKTLLSKTTLQSFGGPPQPKNPACIPGQAHDDINNKLNLVGIYVLDLYENNVFLNVKTSNNQKFRKDERQGNSKYL